MVLGTVLLICGLAAAILFCWLLTQGDKDTQELQKREIPLVVALLAASETAAYGVAKMYERHPLVLPMVLGAMIAGVVIVLIRSYIKGRKDRPNHVGT